MSVKRLQLGYRSANQMLATLIVRIIRVGHSTPFLVVDQLWIRESIVDPAEVFGEQENSGNPTSSVDEMLLEPKEKKKKKNTREDPRKA